MKKFFRTITKRSPSRRRGSSASPAREVGASGDAKGSLPNVSQSRSHSQSQSNSNVSLNTIGYDIKEKDLPKIHKAAWNGDLNKVKQLDRKDASPVDKEQRTPLHLACVKGHAAVVQELLEWKAKINAPDSQNKTPLIKAIECQQVSCVRILLENRANVEAMDSHGNSCLHLAVHDGNYDLTALLLQAGASPNAKNKDGESILHTAVRNNQEEICRLLLQANANVNIIDGEFRIPLMYACQDGLINIVKLLLEYQADTTYKEDKGWTADDYAVIKGHHSCSTLIADHDRKYNRGSAASTPRTGSFPPSATATPRDNLALAESLGLPAQDAAGDDSGDETASRASGHGAAGGGDSWGDDTDISIDDKKSGKPKLNLAKFVRTTSDSEKEESIYSIPDDGPTQRPSVEQQISILSNDSWSTADSPTTPRRVSFKKDHELSEIRDISFQEEKEEEKPTEKKLDENLSYLPTGITSSTPKVSLTTEKQKVEENKSAFLEELGISDVEDISEMSEISGAVEHNRLKTSNAESDWDSTIASDQQTTPRPGILKKWKQEAANNTPSMKANKVESEEDSEWDSDVEDAAMPGTGNITTQSDSQISELNSSETVAIPFIEDQQDKESSLGAVTPRPPSEQQVESDWDSTVEAVTPRQNAGLSFKQVGEDDIDEESIADDIPAPPLPDYPPPQSPRTHPDSPMKQLGSPTKQSESPIKDKNQIEEDEISAWDSDDGDLPSESIPPPVGFDGDLDIEYSNPIKTLQQSPKTTPQTSPRKRDSPKTSPRKSPSPQVSPRKITTSSPVSPRKSPRRQREPSSSDDEPGESETISEWEIERKNKKLLPPPPTTDNIYENTDILTDHNLDRHLQWEEDNKNKQQQLQREAEEAIEAERREIERNMFTDQTDGHDKMTEEKDGDDFGEPRISLDDFDYLQPETHEPTNDLYKEEITTKDFMTSTQTTFNTQPPTPIQSANEPIYSTHRELQQRLQIPGVNTALPVNNIGTTQFTPSSLLDEDEDSYASDNPELPLDRPDATAVNYPGLSTPGHFYNLNRNPPDDDVLSYTSTEFDGDSFAQPVIGKDLLMNLSANDPTTVLKIQEHVRQTQKSFEQERNQRLILDNKYRLLAKEKNDLQKKIGDLTNKKSELEQSKLNLEAKIRSLEYGLREEEEKRKNAEILLGKTKDQLIRKEEQFNDEIEAKQKSELSLRNIQLELRAANNRVQELEDDVKEVERQVQHEKNARQLQEQINEEQQKQHQHKQHQDAVLRSHPPVQRSNSGEYDENAAEGDKLRAELYALQMELDRQRSRLKEENNLLSGENEELNLRIDELKDKIKLSEEAMVHLTMQHNLKQSELNTELSILSADLEKQKSSKEKVDSELKSVSVRLTATMKEMENATQARNDLERKLQQEKETWTNQLDKKDEELASLKLNNNNLSQRIKTMEDKLHQMESELNVSNTSLMERTNQLQQYRQDLDKNKSFNGDSDYNLRIEREQNSKLQMKIENLQEKLNQAQHDSLNFKQQVELVRQSSSQENSASSTERMNTAMNSLRMETEKSKSALEDKNRTLNEALTRLREELRNSDNRRSTLEQDLRKMNQDHNDLIKQMSSSEAQLQIAIKNREQAEYEKNQLKMDIQRLQQKYESSHEKMLESQARISDLVERTERAEQNSLLSTQKLVNTSANVEAQDKSKNEVRDEFQKLQINYARIEAELKHEKQRADMLQEDLLDSQKVRNSLEALCSNLKSTSSHLEEKLNYEDEPDSPLEVETANRTAFELESQESKGLWEQEVVSRSKLGLRLAQLQRQNQDSGAQLNEEKRKVKKVAEVKKTVEARYEDERARNNELEREVTQLKAHLKASRKRLKDTDFNDSRISDLHSEFDKERVQMEATLSTAKRQLEDIKLQLESEVERKEKLENRNRELERELRSVKALETSVNDLETSKVKLETNYSCLKNQLENGSSTEKDVVEQLRKELEAKYRMELNRKLDEVNLYLEEQSRAHDKLNRSRGDNENKYLSDKKRLDDENTSLKLKYEQAVASRESKEIEARRYRDLYESEMRWRLRLSDQLQETTDKSLSLKSKLASEKHRSKLQTSFGNLNMSAISPYESGRGDEMLSIKLRAELDRSIAKHLEAAPHDDVIPEYRSTNEGVFKSSFSQSSAEYQKILHRKYCL